MLGIRKLPKHGTKLRCPKGKTSRYAYINILNSLVQKTSKTITYKYQMGKMFVIYIINKGLRSPKYKEFLTYLSQKYEHTYLSRYMHPYAHCSLIHNS